VKVHKLDLICRQCSHRFGGDVVVEAPVSVFSASAKSLRCPSCGANYKKLDMKWAQAAAPRPIEETT
jgi:hypothetical protein